MPIDVLTINNVNDLVSSCEIRLEPKLGHTYYLYRRDNNENFLSLLSPSEWDIMKNKPNIIHIMDVKLSAENNWVEA